MLYILLHLETETFPIEMMAMEKGYEVYDIIEIPHLTS